MHSLDNFLRDKFLEDITNFLEKYKIKDNTFLLESIIVHLSFRTNRLEIREAFRNIYSKLYQRQFALLEVLSAKQQLEPNRQVFKILKDYIFIRNISVSWPDILNFFISYKNKELIQHPDPIKLFPLTEDQTQSSRKVPPLFIIYKAPAPPEDSETEEDTDLDSDTEIDENSEENLDSEEEEIIED